MIKYSYLIEIICKHLFDETKRIRGPGNNGSEKILNRSQTKASQPDAVAGHTQDTMGGALTPL